MIIRSKNLLLVIADEISTESSDAVQLSTWAAEQNATQLNGELSSHPLEWLRSFLEVLGRLGWIKRFSNFRTLQLESTFQAAEVLQEMLGGGEMSQKLLDELSNQQLLTVPSPWLGTVSQNNSELMMYGVLLVGDVATTGQEGSGSVISKTGFAIQSWQGVLNDAVFIKVKTALQERYHIWLSDRQYLEKTR